MMTSICQAQKLREIEVQALPNKVGRQVVELRGVAAGPFDAAMWETGKLHFLPDQRHPLIAPRPGAFRNIYAPSPVQVEDGWRVFYGAWDGVPTGNDQIYSANTKDFLTFSDRHTVIEHGPFQHVCNVNALRLPGGEFSLICTAYPDAKGLNKPIFFQNPKEPHVPKLDEIVSIEGYDKYDGADINGMNVILYENGKYRLYFGNFRDFGKVYRASGTDGKHYTFEGKALDGHFAVNDVKKFRLGESTRYLMGLHMNGADLSYALGNDGLKFEPARTLFKNLDAADRYIVAVGWVLSGEQEAQGRKVLGVLYGAGAVPSLDANRIFARWLQKRVVFVSGDKRLEAERSLGPDRQILKLGADSIVGRFEVYAEDGVTLLGRSPECTLLAGNAYSIAVK